MIEDTVETKNLEKRGGLGRTGYVEVNCQGTLRNPVSHCQTFENRFVPICHHFSHLAEECGGISKYGQDESSWHFCYEWHTSRLDGQTFPVSESAGTRVKKK